MKKNIIFILTVFCEVIITELFANPGTWVSFLGVLIASTFIIFYAGEMTVCYYILMAGWYAKKDNYTKVKQYYKLIHQISPHSFAGLSARALIFSLEGAWEKAEDKFREALQIRPWDYRMYYNLAIILIRQKKYNEAIWILSYLAYTRPRLPYVFSALGEAHFYNENIKEAKKFFSLALHLNPSDRTAIWGLKLIDSESNNAA